jgi:predicted NUDIX family phosphoesterase
MCGSIIGLISQEATDLEERVLVVDSSSVSTQYGVLPINEEELYRLISRYGSYQLRNNDLESNRSFKQIIPYIVLRKNGYYLFATRSGGGGESRLRGKGTIAFGGHVRAEDVEGKSLDSWGRRELEEELEIGNIDAISYRAIINDRSGGVSDFHLGVLMLVDVVGVDISLREKDKFFEPKWLNMEGLRSYLFDMETWSQLVIESGLV